MNDCDVIVIGSGAGGLTAAVSLARAGKKVMIFEQHYLPGGWCQSFTLDGYRFSPGVHYVGELGPGGRFRRFLEGLGVANDLVFLQLNPDGYDHVRVGNEKFDIPGRMDRFMERLVARFPNERQAIHRYFDILCSVADDMGKLLKVESPLEMLALPFKAPTMSLWGLRSLETLFNHCGIKDPLLQTILGVQGGDYAEPPSTATVALHASIADHYADGAWYPKGGAASIPKAFIKELRRHGGAIKVRAPVEKILLETKGHRRRAMGVRLKDGTEIRSDFVVSNADPFMTFQRLVGSENLNHRLAKKLAKTVYSVSALSLFLAVDMDLESQGLDSGNVWYLREPDLGALYRQASRPMETWAEPFEAAFATVTTLKDRTKRKGPHTLEAFTFVGYDSFLPWADTRKDERPSDYKAFKEALTKRMFLTLEEFIPGIEEKTVFSALGTPLTNQHYVAAHRGNLYGTKKIRFQLGPWSYPVKSPIRNLYLCGASTVAHGVMGAVVSGLVAASSLLRCRIGDLLTAKGQDLRLYSADDPSTWPDEMQQKLEQVPEAGAI